MVAFGSRALEFQQWINTLETTGLYETAVAPAHMTFFSGVSYWVYGPDVSRYCQND
jgi:hypothetical protein